MSIPDTHIRSREELIADLQGEIRTLARERNAVILAHNYERAEVQDVADYVGDSLGLSREAAKTDADVIVFCGVHFMAESADILRAPHQKVLLPDLAAGCSMADMAAEDQLEVCWRELRALGVDVDRIVPVTYINSSAAIKAFVGEHGGVVCTSTNAAAVMSWAFERGERLLMLPDQHLGRNTGYRLGIPLDRMAVWDPHEIDGGLTAADAQNARLLLWKGHCSVHTRFTVQQIQAFRKKHPEGKVIAHPECTFDVVQAADLAGSTEFIIDTLRKSPAGSVWAVATEIHLVNRLMRELAPDRTIVTLDPFGCLCSTMFRVSPNHLLWVLDGLVEGTLHNQIIVPDETKRWAKLALDRMLEIR